MACTLDARVLPWPRGRSNEANRVLERGFSNALLYSRMHDLRERSHSRRTFEQRLERKNGKGMDLDIIQQRRAGTGDALAEAGPVVDDRNALRIARDEGDP